MMDIERLKELKTWTKQMMNYGVSEGNDLITIIDLEIAIEAFMLRKGDSMLVNSRAKGKRGELEIVRLLKNYGYDCRRGQQYNGIGGEDIVGLPGTHWEIKRVQKLNLTDAYLQSKRDAQEGQIPIVCHRKDYEDWLVTLSLEDFMTIYREWESGRGEMGGV